MVWNTCPITELDNLKDWKKSESKYYCMKMSMLEIEQQINARSIFFTSCADEVEVPLSQWKPMIFLAY